MRSLIYNKLIEELPRENVEILLQQWIRPIAQFAYNNTGKKWDTVHADDIISFTKKARSATKRDLIAFCVLCYSDMSFVKDYYDFLSTLDKQIVYRATWEDEISQKDLEKMFGKKIWQINKKPKKPDASFFYGRLHVDLVPEMITWSAFIEPFPDSVYYYGYLDPQNLESTVKLNIKFPKSLRQVFAEVIPKPDGYFLKPIEIPKGITTVSFENDIFNELPLFLAYYQQGNITYIKRGLPSIPSVKKMKKMLGLKSFPRMEDLYTREIMIAGLFSDNFSWETSEDILKILRGLFRFNRLAISSDYFTPNVLFFIKNIRNVDNYHNYSDATSNIIHSLRNFPIGEWISKENIIVHLRTHFISIRPTYYNSFPSMESVIGEEGNFQGRLDEKAYWNRIILPNLLGHYYLMASFGLVDIAVDPQVAWRFSCYDDFFACRLTRLGAYILELTDEYTAPESNDKLEISLEEHSLIVKTNGNEALSDVLFLDFLKKVNVNRYQLSPDIFLKDCKKENDIRNKIDAFKTLIGKEFPPLWNDYFDELIQNSRAVKKKSGYSVFEISEKDSRLIKILTRDRDLRQMVVKAENFRILVKNAQLKQFETKLLRYGYLL